MPNKKKKRKKEQKKKGKNVKDKGEPENKTEQVFKYRITFFGTRGKPPTRVRRFSYFLCETRPIRRFSHRECENRRTKKSGVSSKTTV